MSEKTLNVTQVHRLYTVAALGARKAREDAEKGTAEQARALQGFAAELNGITRVLELAMREARERGRTTILITDS